MTSSFTPQARPVDTFVAPSTVAPTDGFDQLVRALQTVNPGINKFIDFKLDEAIEDEQTKYTNIAIQEELDKGTYGNIVGKARKKDGEDAANQLIGASIFGRKAYYRQKTANAGLRINNILQNKYKTDLIDTVDMQGNSIQIPVNQLSPTQPEFSTWYNKLIKTELDNISGDLDQETLNKFFYPKMQEAVANLHETASKNFNELNKNKLLDESTVKIKENSKLFLRTQVHSFLFPESKKIILEEIANDFKTFDIDMRNAGITGLDRTKLNEQIMNNAINIGKRAVYENGYTPNQARSLVNFLADSIPSSSKGKSLKNNPKWIEKSTDFYTEMYQLELTAAERPAKLKKIDEQNAFTKDIEDYRKETDPTLRSQKYEALKLNYPRKEYQSDIDEYGVLDNKPFMEKATELKKKITRGRFFVDGTPDKGSAFLELDKLEKLDLTPDSETKEELEKIEKAIKGMASYSNNLDSIEDDIINQVKDALKDKGPFGGGYLNNKNSKLVSRFARILEDEADQEMSDFIDTNDRPMTRLEIKQMYRRLEDLLFLEVDILNEDEAGVRVPQVDAIGTEGDIPNPFSEARRKPKKNKSNENNNKILNDPNMFDTPQLKSQSSNVLDQTINAVANALTPSAQAGTLDDAPNIYTVKDGDNLTTIAEQNSVTVPDLLKSNNILDPNLIRPGDKIFIPSSQEEQQEVAESTVTITKGTKQQSIATAAKTLGVKPEHLAAVISKETSGTFNSSIVGTKLL